MALYCHWDVLNQYHLQVLKAAGLGLCLTWTACASEVANHHSMLLVVGHHKVVVISLHSLTWTACASEVANDHSATSHSGGNCNTRIVMTGLLCIPLWLFSELITLHVYVA